jgi:hypothetical protein
MGVEFVLYDLFFDCLFMCMLLIYDAMLLLLNVVSG